MCHLGVLLRSSMWLFFPFFLFIFFFILVNKRNCSNSVLTANYLIPCENSDNPTHIQRASYGHFAQLTIMSQCQILFLPGFSFRRMVFNSNKRLKTSKQTPEFYLSISLSCVWPLWHLLLSPEDFLTQGTLHTPHIRSTAWHSMSFHTVSHEISEHNLVMFWSNLRSFLKTKTYTVKLLVSSLVSYNKRKTMTELLSNGREKHWDWNVLTRQCVWFLNQRNENVNSWHLKWVLIKLSTFYFQYFLPLSNCFCSFVSSQQ